METLVWNGDNSWAVTGHTAPGTGVVGIAHTTSAGTN
jgi:hypothetical protein